MKKNVARTNSVNNASSETKTISAHLHEIRNRLLWCFIAITIGSAIGYLLNSTILFFLIEPLKQPIYYTSPTGAFEVVFKISLLFGFIVSSPVLLYHLLRFLEPAISPISKKILLSFLLGSWLLMLLGLGIAYYISLPAALHFLGEFRSENVKSLISTNEYFSFILRYLGGFALLFQLPLLMLIINLVSPLQPKKLIKYARYIIFISFILAALITPTPDPVNQSIMALPIILLYLFSILLIWKINRLKYCHSLKQNSFCLKEK